MAEVTGPLSHNDAFAPCSVCGSKGKPCGLCRLDYYCGTECQRQDWARHKVGCGAVKLCSSEALGRYLVATKDVPAGTALLREQPILVLPPPWNRTDEGLRFLFCVGCMSACPAFHKRCKGCGWPVCSRSRCSSPELHRPECEAFQRAGFKFSKEYLKKDIIWMALSALRTHLASQSKPRVLDLQAAHSEPLEATGPQIPQLLGVNDDPYFRSVDSAATRQHEQWPAAARWLREVAGLDWIPEADLVRAAGINDINAISLSPLNACDRVSRLAAFVFPGLAMIEHSCLPTCFVTALDTRNVSSQEHLVVASRDLRRGDHLSLDYLDSPFQSTVNRRSLLRRSWSFVCHCERCEDPTTNGTHLGSPCCPDCTARGEKRLMVADTEAATGPSREVVYRCEGCGQSANVPDCTEADERGLDLKTVSAKLHSYENLFKTILWPRGPLHENHHITLNCQFAGYLAVSTQIYLEGGIREPELTIRLVGARELLKKMEAVKPGLNQHRSTMLAVVYDLLYHSVESGGLDGPDRRQVLKTRLSELMKLLELLRPFYIGREEKKFFQERYEDNLQVFIDLWNNFTHDPIV